MELPAWDLDAIASQEISRNDQVTRRESFFISRNDSWWLKFSNFDAEMIVRGPGWKQIE